MHDPRLEQLADVLTNYSTAVRPGDFVRLAGPPVARPLLAALYKAVLLAGGHPHVQMIPDECAEMRLELGSDEQIRFEDPIDRFMVERVNASIALWGQDNTKSLSQIDPQRQASASQARKHLTARFLERAAKGELRWVGSPVPLPCGGPGCQMSLAGYERFVFEAGLLHLPNPAAAWREISRQQQRVVDYLNPCHEVRFTTPREPI